MQPIMSSNAALFPPSVYTATPFFAPLTTASFYRFWEVSVLDWLVQTNDYTSANHFATYSGLVGGETDPSAVINTDGSVAYGGHYGDHMTFGVVRVALSLDGYNLENKVGTPVFHAWDDFVSAKIAALPLSVRIGFQTTPHQRTWQWLVVQDVSLSSSVYIS